HAGGREKCSRFNFLCSHPPTLRRRRRQQQQQQQRINAGPELPLATKVFQPTSWVSLAISLTGTTY
ncbi:hypothetical protein THAOC_32823, partial [Thalassiosira oceanica]